MARFLTVVHHAVLNGCWQRLLPLSVCEQVVLASSSTPSETMNSTSCGVEVGVPWLGLGMMVLICDIAVSKLVSMSLFCLLLPCQWLLKTYSPLMLPAAVCAAVRFDVSASMVLSPL